jgi:hypothetical protein
VLDRKSCFPGQKFEIRSTKYETRRALRGWRFEAEPSAVGGLRLEAEPSAVGGLRLEAEPSAVGGWRQEFEKARRLEVREKLTF